MAQGAVIDDRTLIGCANMIGEAIMRDHPHLEGEAKFAALLRGVVLMVADGVFADESGRLFYPARESGAQPASGQIASRSTH